MTRFQGIVAEVDISTRLLAKKCPTFSVTNTLATAETNGVAGS